MAKKEKIFLNEKDLSKDIEQKNNKVSFLDKTKKFFSKKLSIDSNKNESLKESKNKQNQDNLVKNDFLNNSFDNVNSNKIEAISSNDSSSELISSIRNMNDPLKELDKVSHNGKDEFIDKINEIKMTSASFNREYIKRQKDDLDNKSLSSKIFLFLKANYSIIRLCLIFFFVFLLIYMFVMLMIPQLSSHSQNLFVSQTSFYSAKLSSDFSKYYLSLTPAGIIFLILFFLSFTFSIIIFLINKDKIISKYQVHSKKERKIYLFKLLTLSIGLGLIFLILFIFMLVPPNMAAVRNYYLDQSIINNGLVATNISDVEHAISQLNPNNFIVSAPTGNPTLGLLKNYLLSYKLKSSFALTFYQSFNDGVVSFSNGIYAIIVLFSVFFISFLILEFVINFILNKKINFNKFFDKQKFIALKEKIKENQIQKRQINFARKQLVQQENELLKSLNDVNLDKIDEEKKLGLISQEELESKISKNNEIKKQLDNLVKQKSEIEKQRISISKIKAAINKVQSNKDMKSGKEKQKITIPDKELDEIFKNLEID